MKEYERIKYCFRGLDKESSTYRMLLLYFILQVIISGLASFVIPLFSSIIFSSTTLVSISNSSIVWLMISLVSAVLDFYGNRFNLHSYYRLEESQFKTHLLSILNKSLSHIKNFSVESIVSRLNDDSENNTNIVIWTIGIFAMIFSCVVTLVWCISIAPTVFFIMFISCFICVYIKRIIDGKVSEYKDRRIRLEHELLELLSVSNQDEYVLQADFLFAAFDSERLRIQKLLKRTHDKEGLWSGFGNAISNFIDVCAKILCFVFVVESECVDKAIIIPMFTIQSTFQNQFYTILDYYSSIHENSESVSRLIELEKDVNSTLVFNLEEDSSFAVAVDGVSVFDGKGRPILSDISFKINRNEKVAIVGQNGCGKTTLLRTIMGIIPSDNGRIFLGGEIGYCPVDHQLFEMSLFENCELINNREVHGCFLENIDNLKVPDSIADAENICCLSQGQIQLASIFRSCLGLPSIVILDEPTRSLSLDVANSVMDYLMSLPCTVIYVSHDETQIEKADRVLYLANGGITELEKNARRDLFDNATTSN